MSNHNRRSSFSSSAAGASAKRPAAGETAAARAPAAAPQQAKKRVALGNLTNKCKLETNPDRKLGAKVTNAKVARPTSTVKKGSATCVCDTGLHQNSVITTFDPKTTTKAAIKESLLPISNEPTQAVAPSSTIIISPNRSGDSVSLDESMSTCNSMNSPDFEYIDNSDTSAIASLERRATNNLHISENAAAAGSTWKKEASFAMETSDSIFDVDSNQKDPQLCATLACDIYKHLRLAEAKKRPCSDFMERVQKDINASMRAILIDWLVEVAEEYRLVPDTLYLAVNYIDRYLSGNEINRQRLQLLGVACMMIAAKYEEICAPQVEEFCYITDNTYFKEEVLQMETAVLNYLKFEMTAPTAKCFLRRFVRVSLGCDEVPLLQLEFLASYVAELSLLEYGFLCYRPSMIAAASVFLARFILKPTKQPWNATLAHYALYKPSELSDCVRALHHLFCNSPSSSLVAVREKYSQHKYKFVAKKYCPPIPLEFFQDLSN